MQTTLPPFWLSVKPDYVIENFEALLEYLSRYPYDTAESTNDDFNKTFACLRTVVDDIFTQTQGSTLLAVAPYKDLDEKLLLRIVACYLLVCEKRREQDTLCLARLIDRLLLSDACTTSSTLVSLQQLLIALCRGAEVTHYGYSWASISHSETFAVETFCYNLARTTLTMANAAPTAYFEGLGTALFAERGVQLAALGYTQCLKTPLAPQIETKAGVTICVPQKEKGALESCTKLAALNVNLKNAQSKVKPSAAPTLKQYDCNDRERVVYVRVVKKTSDLWCKTIDPAYELISGKVYWDGYYTVPNGNNAQDSAPEAKIDRELIIREIKEGEVLPVTLQPVQNDFAFVFNVTQEFYRFYPVLGKMYVGERVSAIFSSEYSMGYQWMTEYGVQVNVYNKSVRDEIAPALEDHDLTIGLRIKEVTKDKKGNDVINGVYELSYYDSGEDDEVPQNRAAFLRAAYDNILGCYLDWVNENAPIFGERTTHGRVVEGALVTPLAHALFRSAEYVSTSTRERLQLLVAARMLAEMCQDAKNLPYISHHIDYLCTLIHFASGEKHPADLALDVEESLAGYADVRLHSRIIDSLSRYKNENPADLRTALGGDDEETCTRVCDLVQASNNLRGKISDTEIARIKKNITTTLGVGDEYRCDENTRINYGEESARLEFKSSLVFPPQNLRTAQHKVADVERQKYEILKTVCGFLNTTTGGELLLGVNDYGYACGISADIEELYQEKRISAPTMDRYISFVKREIDNAFTDCEGLSATPKDITQTRVEYEALHDPEGNDVLRIKIAPYEYGLVKFGNKLGLPDGFAESYVRSGNATVAMTSNMRLQLASAKQHIQRTGETLLIATLQQAIRAQKAVACTLARSTGEEVKHTVDPYRVVMSRRAFIAYDTSENKLVEIKLAQCKDLTALDRRWRKTKPQDEKLQIDLFGALRGNAKPIDIQLRLAPHAYEVLCDEHPDAAPLVKANTEGDTTRFPYLFATQVYDLEGITRFFLGLAKDIEIVKGSELKQHAKQSIAGILL